MNIIDIIDGEILKNVTIKADQVDPIPVSSSYIKKKKVCPFLKLALLLAHIENSRCEY